MGGDERLKRIGREIVEVRATARRVAIEMLAVADAALAGSKRRVIGRHHQLPIQEKLDLIGPGFDAHGVPATIGHVTRRRKEIRYGRIHQFRRAQAAIIHVPEKRVCVPRALESRIQPGKAVIAQENAVAFPAAITDHVGGPVVKIDVTLHVVVGVPGPSHRHRLACAVPEVGNIGHEERLAIPAGRRRAEAVHDRPGEFRPAEHGRARRRKGFTQREIAVG